MCVFSADEQQLSYIVHFLSRVAPGVGVDCLPHMLEWVRNWRTLKRRYQIEPIGRILRSPSWEARERIWKQGQVLRDELVRSTL